MVGNERLYSVSDQGRVYAWFSERLLTHRLNAQGYVQVWLRGNRNCTVAHLVLTAFGRPRPTPGSWFVKHLDGSRENCALVNVEWHPRAELRRGIRKPNTHCSKGHELTVLDGKRRCYTCKPLPEVIVADEVS
jgi:hypothetical protein